jgi:tRNA 2-thiouridine synthesizing protein C
MSAMNRYLFVLRKPAHSGAYVQEMLDIILTTAAFDQQVSILLLDDGVFQLKKGQHPEKVGMKDTVAIFNALEIYDVNDIYTEVESLQERGLNPGDLCLPVQALFRKDIAGLMKRFDVVFSG